MYHQLLIPNISTKNKQRLIVLLFGLMIEYTGLLLILFNQRRLALTIFCTEDKYPAMVYFELLFGIAYLMSNFTVLFAAKYKLINKLLQHKSQHVIYSATTLCAFFFMLILLTPPIFILRFSLFILLLIGFFFLHAYEQLLSIFCLLNIIRSKGQYRTFANIFFAMIGVSIILAKAIHDATNYFVDLDLRIFFAFLPLSILGVIYIVLSRQFNLKINPYDVKRLSYIMKSLKDSWKSQVMRLIANLAVGGFMVEWYANTPEQSYIYYGWSTRSSSIMNLANNLMALLIIYWYGAFINQINKRILLPIILIAFILFDFVVDLMPSGSYAVIAAFFLMTILFNLIIKAINQLVHYKIHDLKLNIFSLIWGSGIGTILFYFLFNTLNLIIMHNTQISNSLLSNFTIGTVVLLSMFAIGKITRIKQ